MTLAPTLEPPRTQPRQSKPETEPNGTGGRILIALFVGVPFVSLFLAVPVAWGWGLAWSDVAIFGVTYLLGGLGVTVGFHRHFTHGSFKAKRGLRIVMAIAGSTALEGSVTQWVADHRKHHKYADREGDPHSPWRFGDDWKALTKGLWYAHMGWVLAKNRAAPSKFCPDLVADKDIRRISAAFPAIVAASLLLPALVGGLWTMSWQGALTAFFWGSLVRISLLHHVTWSINSICHTFGVEDFEVRDKSRNVWWLAVASFGESWHNLHHADPTCARHGVLKGQVDPSARVIRMLERTGLAYNVRWPNEDRIAARRRG